MVYGNQNAKSVKKKKKKKKSNNLLRSNKEDKAEILQKCS